MLVHASVLKDPSSANICGGRADFSCGVGIDFLRIPMVALSCLRMYPSGRLKCKAWFLSFFLVGQSPMHLAGTTMEVGWSSVGGCRVSDICE